LTALRSEIEATLSAYTPNDKAQEQLEGYVKTRLEQMKRDSIFEAYEAKIKGKLEQEAKKGLHNGQPVTAPKDKPNDKPQYSESETAMRAHFAKLGITVPENASIMRK